MADLAKLDVQFRLQPWIYPEHRGFVEGQYGSRLATPESAEAYLQAYEAKEKKADEAYEVQRQLLRASCTSIGTAPQELPDQEKIAWNPREKFRQVVREEKVRELPVESKKVVVEKKVEKVVEKKRGRPVKK